MIRYLKGSPRQGIMLRVDSPLLLMAYCDYDPVVQLQDARSPGILFLWEVLPSLGKPKNNTPSPRSSTETEY